MNQQTSSGKWVVLGSLLLVALALALGISASDSELLNPLISRAQAHQLDVQTDIQEAINENDARIYQAQTDLTIQKMQQQAEYDQWLQGQEQINKVAQDIQEIAARERRAQLTDDLLTLVSNAFALAMVVVACALAVKIALPVVPSLVAETANLVMSTTTKPRSSTYNQRQSIRHAGNNPAPLHMPSTASFVVSRAEQAAINWRLNNLPCNPEAEFGSNGYRPEQEMMPAIEAPLAVSLAEQAFLERRLKAGACSQRIEISGD